MNVERNEWGKQLTIDSLLVGTRVQIIWNGYEGVPKYLSMSFGTITGRGRSRYKVELDESTPVDSDYRTLRVRPDQIYRWGD